MKMVTVKTADLIGPALDWAVAHATKAWEWAHEWFPTMTLDPTFIRVVARECPRGPHGALVMTCLLEPRNPFRQDPQLFSPSVYWSQGGPLIDRYNPRMTPQVLGLKDEEPYCASIGTGDVIHFHCGATYLIAVCRAIVAAKLGDEVQVPAELVQP